MGWTKEQRNLAKERNVALFQCAIDGKHMKPNKANTGAYNCGGPLNEELARKLFFFVLDVSMLDVAPGTAFKKWFKPEKEKSK